MMRLPCSSELKKEFISLITWLKDCTPKKTIVTEIIDKYNKITPKFSFKIISSEIININNKPLYTKFKSGIRLRLKIETFEERLVVFCIERVKPLSLNQDMMKLISFHPFDFYSQDNKKIFADLKDWHQKSLNFNFTKYDYVYKIEKVLNKNMIQIDLPCTVNSNLNKVEVYVDDELIHIKTFKIEIAPSDKIKVEIKKVEDILKNIKNTQYFKSDIDAANLEMNEIRKFKLFRSSTKKQIQNQNQQVKIDKLLEKSKKEKNTKIREQEEKIYKLKKKLSVVKY